MIRRRSSHIEIGLADLARLQEAAASDAAD